MRLALACGLATWLGSTLLLSATRVLNRPSLAQRLRPYGPGGYEPGPGGAVVSLQSLREVVGPLCTQAGAALSRAMGVSEDLSTRLERVHSPLAPTEFRMRQGAWMLGAFGSSGLVVAAAAPPPLFGLAVVVGVPLLAFLVLEQRVISASEAWQRRVFLEAAVVSEQLAMLLGAGYSMGASLARIAERGQGALATDLGRVVARIRTGLGERAALEEWARLVRVDAVDRLVAVLSLNREAADLGRLVSDEARAVRRDVQRELTREAERRAQQVWIPVTVAALVPGVMFLAVPFLQAVRLFAGS